MTKLAYTTLGVVWYKILLHDYESQFWQVNVANIFGLDKPIYNIEK